MNASDSFQIHSSAASRTLANSSPGIVAAAWQGMTSPSGATTIAVRPQPPMHGFGSSSKKSGSTHRTLTAGPTRARKRSTASSPRRNCSRVGISASWLAVAQP